MIDKKALEAAHRLINVGYRVAKTDLEAAITAYEAAKSAEPVGFIYPDDFERMLDTETFCTIYSVEVGSPSKGKTTIALYSAPLQPKAEPVMTDETIERVVHAVRPFTRETTFIEELKDTITAALNGDGK